MIKNIDEHQVIVSLDVGRSNHSNLIKYDFLSTNFIDTKGNIHDIVQNNISIKLSEEGLDMAKAYVHLQWLVFTKLSFKDWHMFSQPCGIELELISSKIKELIQSVLIEVKMTK